MDQKPMRLSVKVLIYNEAGKCLVIRRSGESVHNPVKWDFPGGKVDGGETFDSALLREVSEETGLKIILERAIGVAEAEVGPWHIINLIMQGRLHEGQVTLSSEHDRFQWVSPADLSKLDLVEQYLTFAKTLFGTTPMPAKC